MFSTKPVGPQTKQAALALAANAPASQIRVQPARPAAAAGGAARV